MPAAMSSASRVTTRSMAASSNSALSERRRASFDVNASLPLPSTLSKPPSAAYSRLPRARVLLTDLPCELGILIVDNLTIEAMANLVLCNKTTAGWVSKSLLAKVTRCETKVDEGEREPEAHLRFFLALSSTPKRNNGSTPALPSPYRVYRDIKAARHNNPKVPPTNSSPPPLPLRSSYVSRRASRGAGRRAVRGYDTSSYSFVSYE